VFANPQEFVKVRRLGEIARGFEVGVLDFLAQEIFGRGTEHHYGHPLQTLGVADGPKHFGAGAFRQIEIENHQVSGRVLSHATQFQVCDGLRTVAHYDYADVPVGCLFESQP
jgi:hypothetical protein